MGNETQNNGKDPWAQRIEALQKMVISVPPLVWIIIAVGIYMMMTGGQ